MIREDKIKYMERLLDEVKDIAENLEEQKERIHGLVLSLEPFTKDDFDFADHCDRLRTSEKGLLHSLNWIDGILDDLPFDLNTVKEECE